MITSMAKISETYQNFLSWSSPLGGDLHSKLAFHPDSSSNTPQQKSETTKNNFKREQTSKWRNETHDNLVSKQHIKLDQLLVQRHTDQTYGKLRTYRYYCLLLGCTWTTVASAATVTCKYPDWKAWQKCERRQTLEPMPTEDPRPATTHLLVFRK